MDLIFNYKGRPVSGLDFLYSDGREECDGAAKDGRGMLEMAPGYETEFYHLDIEYEYKNLARGDDELQAVLDVVAKAAFPESSVSVKGRAAQDGTSVAASQPAARLATASVAATDAPGGRSFPVADGGRRCLVL